MRWIELRKGWEHRSHPEWQVGKLIESTSYARVGLETPLDEKETYELVVWVNQSLSHEEVRERYIREVEFADAYVGRLMDELKRKGMYDNSLIVFTSDHGEALGEKGMVGHVETLSDWMIQVPLIIKPPAGHPRAAELAARTNELAPHVNLAPTILDLVAVPQMKDQTGRSIFEAHDVVHVAETHKPESKRDLVCLRDTEYKITYVVDDDRFEMFDVETDPAEDDNIFETHGHLRADWPDKLRAIAAIALDRTRREGELDPELQRQLDALGYGGAKGR